MRVPPVAYAPALMIQAGNVIERPAASAQARDPARLRTLLRRLELRADEGRIAEHEGTAPGRKRRRPVHLQRVAVQDVGRGAQRDAGIGLTEFQAQPVVHDVVHHPQRGFRDADGELADLDPVELIDVDDREVRHVDHQLTRPGRPGRTGRTVHRRAKLAEHLDFEQAEFPVGDDEEIAAAAGGIEEGHLTEALMEGSQRRLPPPSARLDALQLRPEIIQEERPDHLEDVPLGGVVRALSAAFRPGP